MLNESVKPMSRDDVQYCELDDGGAIYDTVRERVHTLNLTASYIWNLCDGSRSVLEIVSEVRRLTNVPTDTASRDVREAILYFQNEGMLRIQ